MLFIKQQIFLENKLQELLMAPLSDTDINFYYYMQLYQNCWCCSLEEELGTPSHVTYTCCHTYTQGLP